MLLAHQGGWDEILFVLAPLALFAVLLVVARRRVDQLEQEDEPGPISGPESDATGTTGTGADDDQR